MIAKCEPPPNRGMDVPKLDLQLQQPVWGLFDHGSYPILSQRGLPPVCDALQGNLLVSGIASLAGAAAPSMQWLIAARFVMGIGFGTEIVVSYVTPAEPVHLIV